MHLDARLANLEDLLCAFGRVVLGIENEKQDVLVHKMIIAGSDALVPHTLQHSARQVVVTTNIENGCGGTVRPLVKLVPLSVNLVEVLRASLYQVTDIDDEFRT